VLLHLLGLVLDAALLLRQLAALLRVRILGDLPGDLPLLVGQRAQTLCRLFEPVCRRLGRVAGDLGRGLLRGLCRLLQGGSGPILRGSRRPRTVLLESLLRLLLVACGVALLQRLEGALQRLRLFRVAALLGGFCRLCQLLLKAFRVRRRLGLLLALRLHADALLRREAGVRPLLLARGVDVLGEGAGAVAETLLLLRQPGRLRRQLVERGRAGEQLLRLLDLVPYLALLPLRLRPTARDGVGCGGHLLLCQALQGLLRSV